MIIFQAQLAFSQAILQDPYEDKELDSRRERKLALCHAIANWQGFAGHAGLLSRLPEVLKLASIPSTWFFAPFILVL
jgi:hypothetical protein